MKSTLRFLTEVDEDATAAYEWYEERAAGLGERFLQEVNLTAKRSAPEPTAAKAEVVGRAGWPLDDAEALLADAECWSVASPTV